MIIISQIRNAGEPVLLYRICERQNHITQSATDAKHLDFGVEYIINCKPHIMEYFPSSPDQYTFLMKIVLLFRDDISHNMLSNFATLYLLPLSPL